MTSTPHQPAPPTTNVTLALDVTCRGCGYNLRGLSPAGRCPECGRPVRGSLAGDALHAADLAWLGHLVSGASLICTGLLFSLLTLLAVGVPVSAVIGNAPLMPILLLPLVLAALTASLTLVGAWRLTTREPDHHPGSGAFSRRWCVRLASLATTAVLLSASALWLASARWPDDTRNAAVPATFLLLPAAIMTGAALAHHLLQLVRRTPAAGTAREAAMLRNLSAGLALVALMWCAAVALPDLPADPLRVAACGVTALSALYTVIVYAAWFYVMPRITRVLGAQLRLAEAHGGPDHYEPPVPPGKQEDAAWPDVGHGGPTLLKPAAPRAQEDAW
jgi:hypothetical protein